MYIKYHGFKCECGEIVSPPFNELHYCPFKEVWKNIDTIIITRLFQKELVVGKQKEIEGEED